MAPLIVPRAAAERGFYYYIGAVKNRAPEEKISKKDVGIFADSKIVATFASAFEKNGRFFKEIGSAIRRLKSGSIKFFDAKVLEKFGRKENLIYLCSPFASKARVVFQIGSLIYWFVERKKCSIYLSFPFRNE